MSNLPVIVGFGGINAAGRSSFHHAYQRMVFESLNVDRQAETVAGLSTLMNLTRFEGGAFHSADGRLYTLGQIVEALGQKVHQGTLIRRIEAGFFDVDNTK